MKLEVRPELSPVVHLPARALAEELAGPTLFDLRQEDKPPLFVSVLVHGNEPSGWDAVRNLHHELERASALVFVGNVTAAQAGVRTLPGRVDFNRVWEGGNGPEAALAAEVVAIAAAAKPKLAIDMHNNTGRNPPYAVIARTDQPTLKLARRFSNLTLFGTQPGGYQTRRFAEFCPAATVEVGTPDDPASTDRATAFLRDLLEGAPRCRRPAAPSADPSTQTLFETAARVTVSANTRLAPDTQRYNFRTAPAGTVLAQAGTLRAWSADGREIGSGYFRRRNGATVLSAATPIAMYTPDLAAARLDCLCYLLEARSVHA